MLEEKQSAEGVKPLRAWKLVIKISTGYTAVISVILLRKTASSYILRNEK